MKTLEEKCNEVRGKEYPVKNTNPDRYDPPKRILVVDADPDIGLTLVDAEDKTEYYLCILGPLGFKAKYKRKHPEPEACKEKIAEVVDILINTGEWDHVKGVEKATEKMLNSPNSITRLRARLELYTAPNETTCAFNQ